MAASFTARRRSSILQPRSISRCAPRFYMHARVGVVCLSWLLAFVVLASAWTVALASPRKASAGDERVEAWLIVRSVQPRLIQERQAVATEFEFGLFRRTQAELIRTPMVLNAALRSAEIADLPLLARQQDPVGWLRHAIRVDFPGDSELMRVSMRGGSEEAAKIVNAVVKVYLSEVVHRDKQITAENYETLIRSSESLREQIAREQGNYKRLSETLGFESHEVDLSNRVLDGLAHDLRDLSRQSAAMQFELENAHAAGKEAKERPVHEHLVQQELAKDPELAIRLPRRIELETQLAEAKLAASAAQDGTESPHVARLTRLYEAERAAIDDRTAKLRPSIEAELLARSKPYDRSQVARLDRQMNLIDAQIAEVKARYAATEKRLKRLGSLNPELKALQSKIEQYEFSYRQVASEVRAIEVDLKAPSRVYLVQTAVATE